jgi:hypothetical protein
MYYISLEKHRILLWSHYVRLERRLGPLAHHSARASAMRLELELDFVCDFGFERRRILPGPQ